MPRTARGLHYEVTDLRAPWLRERQSGRPVVLHHGVGASLGIFAEWMPIVAARHPVARFDMHIVVEQWERLYRELLETSWT